MKQTIDTFTDKYGNTILKIYISKAYIQKRPKILHRHTEFEISMILSGKGIYNTNMGDFEFSKGDIFLFSTNEYHNISDILECDGQDYMEILNIQFAPVFIYNDDNAKDTAFMNIFLNRLENFSNMLPRDNPCTHEIQQRFLTIMEECEEKKPCYYIETRNHIISLLISIFRNYNFANFKQPTTSIYNDINGLQKAIAFINENYCDEISLDNIATAAYFSKFHFIRLFKTTYNMTVWDYINIKRIDKAVNLLTKTNDTVINIASKCGFNSPANFNRIFKKLTGLTPKECRKHAKTAY